MHSLTVCSIIFLDCIIGVGAGPAGQVLAGPLLFKVKNKMSFLQKASNEQKC